MDYICEINRLSLERAKKIAPPEFLPAWEWYMAHAGMIGPKPYGPNQPEGINIRMSAQRGIHKPGGFDYALAITSTASSGKSSSFYSDQPIVEQDDGTWIFQYSAHRNNKGNEGKYDDEWNRSLRACLRDGIPVAVFISNKGGQYSHMGLAFVEAYNEESDLFTLHGPVTAEQSDSFWSLSEPADLTDAERKALEEIDNPQDERKRQLAERVIREGQQLFRSNLMRAYEGRCAATSCDVEKVLQAAHIIGYRGKASQATSNGLLLRSDVHQLYDAHLLSVNPDNMKIELARSLAGTDYERLYQREIALPKDKRDRPEPRRLEVHYREFVGASVF